jgi:hypothetical protein
LVPPEAVVVPARRGPIVPLAPTGTGDEIDAVLDDLLGERDDKGPGPADAVLLIGGSGAVVAALVFDLAPAVVVLGVIAVALGAVLPLRFAWGARQRVAAGRRQQRLLGDGVVLRVDHRAAAELMQAYRSLTAAAASLAAEPRAQVDQLAFDAVREVATLLDGRCPTLEAEVAYVEARTVALRQIAATMANPLVGDGDAHRRGAVLDARREIEEVAGTSSLDDARRLRIDLLGGHDD